MGYMRGETDLFRKPTVVVTRGGGEALQRIRCLQDEVVSPPDFAKALGAETRDHPVAIREHSAGHEPGSRLSGIQEATRRVRADRWRRQRRNRVILGVWTVWHW